MQNGIHLREQQEEGESGVDQGATRHHRSVDQTIPRRQAVPIVARCGNSQPEDPASLSRSWVWQFAPSVRR